MHFSTTFGAPKEKFIDPLKSFLLLVADNFQTDKNQLNAKESSLVNCIREFMSAKSLSFLRIGPDTVS